MFDFCHLRAASVHLESGYFLPFTWPHPFLVHPFKLELKRQNPISCTDSLQFLIKVLNDLSSVSKSFHVAGYHINSPLSFLPSDETRDLIAHPATLLATLLALVSAFDGVWPLSKTCTAPAARWRARRWGQVSPSCFSKGHILRSGCVRGQKSNERFCLLYRRAACRWQDPCIQRLQNPSFN